MNSKITEEELEIIKHYKNEKHVSINQQLVEDVESDIALLSAGNSIDYSKDIVIENIDLIKKIYEIMIKNFKETDNWCFFRATNIAEIEKIKINSNINKFLSVTTSEEEAENKFSSNWSRPVFMKCLGDKNIPYINIDDTNDIIISPFTRVVEIKELEEKEDINSSLKEYEVILENQELQEIPENEKNNLYDDILQNVEMVSERLNACIELEQENTVHYENIRKLEQLLAKHNFAMEQENYEQDTTEAERQADLDDISRINMELDTLKDVATKVFEIRKENLEFISNWKKDVITYLKAECCEIRKKYTLKENENVETEEVEEVEKVINSKIVIPKTTGDEFIDDLRAQSAENIAMVNTLLTNIKNLISKQQNHARIAEAMDSNYKALNNAFQMKNYAEELESLVKAINDKIEINLENRDVLSKISKTNIQISTFINYLNNPKSTIQKRITRFDEINIIEENELKREIAETIKNIRCEAELKKLRDDIDIIEDKSSFKKFLDKLTGKSKINQTMLDQIEVRQTAIRKTFKNKMPLAYNYSIHELIAEIEMFIKENSDDELVLEDVNNLRKIEEILKKNFVIIDSKVVSIIDQKTGKNLPLASRKLSKTELIEIDTYRFLNRYGYDKSVSNNEPEYQDTIANEIKTIVDYIKSSGVL